MDLDADGNRDVISGSYWPGHIFLFKGQADGTFAKGVELTDASGAKLHGGKKWKSNNEPDMNSLAAAPWLIDFDADGDLDLLIGNIAGTIVLVKNEGTAKAHKFTTERVLLQAGDQTIKVGGGDAGPHTADWDGDGKWDLLTGAGDGSVQWFRNVGTKSAPKFEAGVFLVAKNKNGYQALKPGAEPTTVGLRTKLCVVDYNGDGAKDLLIGGFTSVAKPMPELSKEQIARRDELRKQRDAAMSKFRKAAEAVKGDRAKVDELSKEYSKTSREIYNELKDLEPGMVPSGWVWFYQRKTAAAQHTR